MKEYLKETSIKELALIIASTRGLYDTDLDNLPRNIINHCKLYILQNAYYNRDYLNVGIQSLAEELNEDNQWYLTLINEVHKLISFYHNEIRINFQPDKMYTLSELLQTLNNTSLPYITIYTFSTTSNVYSINKVYSNQIAGYLTPNLLKNQTTSR